MTIQQLDQQDEQAAHDVLLLCCGSPRWVEAMLAKRPFRSRENLLSAAEEAWWAQSESEWLTAFAAHPRIGAEKLSEWCSQEQRGLEGSARGVLEDLARGNAEYEKRFGWIFLVNASGKTGRELLASLQSRLDNDRKEELRVAAGEQARITALRLGRLLDS